MGPLYDQVGGDGGLPSSSTSNNVNNNNERKSGFRKYALLIQDSLAIKFVPVTPTETPQQFPHASQYHNSGGNHPTVGFSNNGNPIISDNPHESISNNNETSEKSVNKRDHISLSNNGGGGTTSTGGLLRSSRGLLADRTSSTSASRDVDHSLHALYLFKGFQESNLKCYWNGGLSETIRNIEYKGYIVPSIILVTALPRYLTILRTAWSRRMLRSPPGYRIKFIGEVEELVAEPIGQGQFAPLSDSLCWAILELTSIGEEAFVDPIMAVLKGKFPSMSCPSRELVFQTLEKLIRERKIYQTANGYFVVTPDTFRFMTSAAPHHLFNPSINLDALIPYDDTPDKSLHNPWESHQLQSHPKDTTGDKEPVTNESTTADSTPSNGNKLKRHSSLKTFRQRDICDAEAKESFGTRGTSMRLSKSLSCDQMDKDNDKDGDEEGLKSPKIGRRSTLSQITTLMRNFKMNVSDSSARNKRSTKLPALDRNTKGKSLFSRLFGRSRSKSREPREPRDEISSPANTNGAITVDAAAVPPANITTTLVPVSSDEASSSSSATSSPAHVRPDTTDSALYDVLSDPSTSSSIGDNNKLSSLDQQDNLHDDDHHHHTPFPVPANFPSFHSRDEPSRCSTLSHATSSLGYGSEGYPSLNLSSPSSTHSPCPYESMRNTSTRHSINNGHGHHGYSTGGMKASKRTTSTADFYQRRYPSYSHSFSRNSPYYASLTSPTRIKVPSHSLYDSLLTTTSSSQSTPKSNEFSKPSPYGNGNKHSLSETTGMNETKVTQTVKSTTDMELQLLLPLGNIMKAAINAKKQELKDNFFRQEFSREPPPQPAQHSQNRKSSNNSNNSHDQDRADHDIPIHLDKSSGIKLNVSEPKSSTEIKTRIDKNGVVEEHYQNLPNVDISNTRSKVEININGKSLDFGWTNHNGKIRKISTQHVAEQKTATGTDSLSPSPHTTPTCGQFDNSSINGNHTRTSKWSTLGGVTLCNNVGQGFQDDIKVSII